MMFLRKGEYIPDVPPPPFKLLLVVIIITRYVVNAVLHWVSQTRIYPGTTHLLSMSTRTHTQLSMSKWTQALNRSMPNQWA